MTTTNPTTTTISQDVNRLHHRVLRGLGMLTPRQRAVEFAMTVLSAGEYAIVLSEGRRLERDSMPDGLADCAAHLRGDCHDGSTCPICRAERSGIVLGRTDAIQRIACG